MHKDKVKRYVSCFNTKVSWHKDQKTAKLGLCATKGNFHYSLKEQNHISLRHTSVSLSQLQVCFFLVFERKLMLIEWIILHCPVVTMEKQQCLEERARSTARCQDWQWEKNGPGPHTGCMEALSNLRRSIRSLHSAALRQRRGTGCSASSPGAEDAALLSLGIVQPEPMQPAATVWAAHICLSHMKHSPQSP